MFIFPLKRLRLFPLLLLLVLIVACGPPPAPSVEETRVLPEGGDLPTATAIATTPSTTMATPVATEESAETTAETETAPALPEVAVPTRAAIDARPLTALGDPEAPVTIVEYSDYHCPFCRQHFEETLPQLLENYVDSGRVYYVFKDFPIANLHPLAYRLHEAALCVGDVGGSEAYWEAHDLFFEQAERFQAADQAALDEVILTTLADSGLPDVEQCLQNDTFADEVEAGVAEGQALGVSGTPSFFINGYPIVGAQPYEIFEYAISLAETGQLEERFRQAAQEEAAAQATATAQASQPADVPLGDAPAKGDPEAPVTIVEYSDYQCPFCLRHFEQTMPQLDALIEAGEVRYLFKDFPIARIHPEAAKAHEAARCARDLGGDEAYWQMHDLIFANQDAWAGNSEHVAVLKSLATEAGLAQEAFAACLDSGRYAEAVQTDLSEGQSLGVNGTPTFFINGQRLVGAQPFVVFQQAIEQAQP